LGAVAAIASVVTSFRRAYLSGLVVEHRVEMMMTSVGVNVARWMKEPARKDLFVGFGIGGSA
jgi:hypothetical protein